MNNTLLVSFLLINSFVTVDLPPRFPETDYSDFLLPESVPLFCLPSGVSVEHWDRRATFPLPSFSIFALTNERGLCVSAFLLVERWCSEN